MSDTTQQIELPEPWEERHGSTVVNVNPERWLPAGATEEAIRYRIRWTIAGGRRSTIEHDPGKAVKAAKAKAKELDDGERPPSAEVYQSYQEKAVLYDLCAKVLEGSGMNPLTACQYMARLFQVMDLEGLEKFIAVYLPLLRKCKPLSVEDGVKDYRPFLFEDGVAKTEDEKRKDRCLTLFSKHFSRTDFRFITVEAVCAFLKVATAGQDMRNKFLYCLRALFVWARDYKEALPPRHETVCDLIVGKRPESPDPEIYSVEAFAWLASLAVDKEMVLALTLTGQHFLRQEEAEKMRGEYFTRDPQGFPYEIKVPANVSKTDVERTIPIEPRFQELFKILLPVKGPIFHSKKPFKRIEGLARALGIEIKSNGYRHSCVSYNIAAGMKREVAANLAGHDVATQGIFYFVSVAQPEGIHFKRITFNLERVRGMQLYNRVNFKSMVVKKKFRKIPNLNRQEAAEAD